MKKLTALVALALLAIAGTGYAVTCAQDNVPGATLLVPYFRVGGTGVVGFNDIPDSSGTDTLVAVTNTSNVNIVLHVTVWNKYSAPVLDFNVPMSPYDVVFWSMRDILNGKLIVNPAFQKYTVSSGVSIDPCGQRFAAGAWIGYQTTAYTRFSAVSTRDQQQAISVYNTPAFSGVFRQQVWTSLDESGDITAWTGTGSIGTGVLDADNYACLGAAGSAVVGDFSGYVTIDLANFCTLDFPTAPSYYINDAIATRGWGSYPGTNVLMGDVFYKDQAPGTATANIGNISGDPALHLEFDARLPWNQATANSTFYGRYNVVSDGYTNPINSNYGFPGDGREPLSQASPVYGFRYMQTAAPTALRTWALIWRGDLLDINSNYSNVIPSPNRSLCAWWAYYVGADVTDSTFGLGFKDTPHQPTVSLWDNDEGVVSINGCPSPCPGVTPGWVFLETQRLVITPNAAIVPANFLGGWIAMGLPGFSMYNQSWVGIQHSGLGLAMSVGHHATNLSGQFVCTPAPSVTFPWPGQASQTGAATQTAN